MGEVYRARDTRLGRDVAVKVLPQHLSASPEVRARFEREARAVSALAHPHICVLFDVGSEGGDRLPGHGAGRGRDARGPARARRAARPGGPGARDPDRRRAGAGAPRGDRPPRPEARQRHAHPRRRQADGLRSGPPDRPRRQRLGAGRRAHPDAHRGRAADRRGHPGRDLPVHVARAARGQGGRRTQRRLGARLRAPRDGLRPARLLGHQPGEPDRRGHGPAGAAARRGGAARAAGTRAAGRRLPGQGPRGPGADRPRRRPAARVAARRALGIRRRTGGGAATGREMARTGVGRRGDPDRRGRGVRRGQGDRRAARRRGK